MDQGMDELLPFDSCIDLKDAESLTLNASFNFDFPVLEAVPLAPSSPNTSVSLDEEPVAPSMRLMSTPPVLIPLHGVSVGTSEEDTSVKGVSPVKKETKTTQRKTQQQQQQQKKRVVRNSDDDEDDDSSGGYGAGAMPNSNIQYEASKRKGNAFAFTKDEVARMTPIDLDRYEAQVRAHHELSTDELAFLKKYRRQVRNRESAQNSRARKRQQAENLQSQVDVLQQKNNDLEKKVGMYDKEVQKLRSHVHYLEQTLRENNVPFTPMSSGFAPSSSTIGRASLGVMAFALVFCFGFFFPVRMGSSSSGPILPPTFAGNQRQLLSEVPVAAVQSASNEKQVPAVVQPARPSCDAKGGGTRIRIVDRPASTTTDAVVSATVNTKALVPMEGVVGSPFVRTHSRPSVHSVKWDRPNTDYLYCPAAHHVLSNRHDENDPNSEFANDDVPSRVSLLLPTEAFNGTIRAFKGPNAPPLVEVTCSVLDVWPVWPLGLPDDVKAVADV